MRFNKGYNENLENKIKIRFTSVLQAKRAYKILGKNEESPIGSLDLIISKGQQNLLENSYVDFRLINET